MQVSAQPLRKLTASAQPLRHRVSAQAAVAEEQDAMVAGTGGAKGGPPDPKLVALRQQMAAAEGGKGVDVYIIPTEDPHMVRGFPLA